MPVVLKFFSGIIFTYSGLWLDLAGMGRESTSLPCAAKVQLFSLLYWHLHGTGTGFLCWCNKCKNLLVESPVEIHI